MQFIANCPECGPVRLEGADALAFASDCQVFEHFTHAWAFTCPRCGHWRVKPADAAIFKRVLNLGGRPMLGAELREFLAFFGGASRGEQPAPPVERALTPDEESLVLDFRIELETLDLS